MSDYTYYSIFGSIQGNPGIIAASYAEIPINVHYMDWSDIKSKENLERNPSGQTPVLKTPKGYIAQSMAILRFIGSLDTKKNLYGTNEFQKAQIDQWIDFLNFELQPYCIKPLRLKLCQWKEISDEEVKESYKNLEKYFPYMENHLKGKKFFVGDAQTLVDFCMFTHLVHVFRCVLPQEIKDRFPNIITWFENQASLPVHIKYYGKNRYSKQPWY